MTQQARMNLPARQLLLWLVLLLALVANATLALAHLVLGGAALLVTALWAVRLLALGACWVLLPGSRTTKAWGLGLVLGFLVLDALAKAPVLGSVEYGDWFLARSLDLTGQYTGYLVTCGFLFPMLLLAGWFILRGRRRAGWIGGLAASLLTSLALLLAGDSTESTTVTFVVLDLARFIIPVWVAALADVLAARRAAAAAATGDAPGKKLSTKFRQRRQHH